MSALAEARPLELLLVEDDPGDIVFTREALEEVTVPLRLNVVTDGEKALGFLRRQGEYQAAPRPDLVLLDLNLPKISGIEVLAAVKGDPSLRAIPIIIFTTSTSEDDLARTYDLHANSFVTKPLEFVGYAATFRAIESFWMQTATLPRT